MASLLSPAETTLWGRMSGPDRRHAVTVAQRVEAALSRGSGAEGPSCPAPAPAPGEPGGAPAPSPVLVAALLHDVGKVEAGLGTAGRVVATLVGLAGGRRRAEVWAARSGWLGQVGRYLGYPHVGAALLEAAGSDPLTVAWAAQHHLAPERCQLPAALAAALRAADQG